MFFLRALPTGAMIDRYVTETGVGQTEVVASALSMLRTASQLTRLLDAYFATHGTSQLRFLILVVIDREPDTDRLRPSEIKERLDVSKPVLTRTVAAMLSAGLLKRSEDTADSRAHHLALTDAGKGLLTAILPGYFRTITDFMQKHE